VEEVGDLDAVGTSTAAGAQPSPAVRMVLFGPPRSGCSTQAQLLAERYSVPAVTLDQLLKVGPRRSGLGCWGCNCRQAFAVG
jgi:hypothetical protein